MTHCADWQRTEFVGNYKLCSALLALQEDLLCLDILTQSADEASGGRSYQ